MLRHVLAVAAGFAVWTVLFMGAAAGVQALFPEAHGADGSVYATAPLVLYLLLAVAASLAAGYTTWRVAEERHTRVVLATALVLLAVGVAVQATSWSLTPAWYNVVFLLSLVPFTVLGGRLADARAPAAG